MQNGSINGEEEYIPVLPNAWAGWKLTDVIGSGSCGMTYLARNGETEAAVKIITIGNDGHDADLLASCLQEIEFLYALRDDPHIVRIEDHLVTKDETDGTCRIFIRMELLEDLQQRFESLPVTAQEVVRIGCDICDALSLCAAHNIVHCDVKAGNIFYGKDGCYKLGDFGIASRQFHEGAARKQLVKGTPSSMAPESYLEGSYSHRSDIYALGLILYRLQNRNRDPFVDTDKKLIHYQEREEALTRRMRGEPLPPPSEAPARLCTVILKACEYDPELRYENAAAFRNDLQCALSAGSLSAGSSSARQESTQKAYATDSIAIQTKPEAGSSLPRSGSPLNRGISRPQLFKILITCIIAAMILLSACLLLLPKLRQKGKTAAVITEENEGSVFMRENPTEWSEDMQEAAKAAQAVLTEMGEAAQSGKDAFSAYLITEEEALINEYYTDLLDLDLYPQRVFTPVAESDGIFLVNVLAWSEEKAGSDDSWSKGWNLFLEKDNGRWRLNLEEDTLERFAKILHEGAYPEGFENVLRDKGHNCVMVDRNNYLYLDSTKTYADMAVMQVRFIWQDPQGDVYVSVLFANGLEEPCTFENLSLRLNDRQIGTILDGSLPGSISVPAGANVLRTWQFEADAVRTGLQNWEDVTPVLVME